MKLGVASTSRKIVLDENYIGTIVQDKYNPLIKRREIIIIIDHPKQGTPMRFALREALAKHYNVDIEKVYVEKIESEYGMARTRVEAHIYDEVSRALKFEPKYIIERNKGFEEE